MYVHTVALSGQVRLQVGVAALSTNLNYMNVYCTILCMKWKYTYCKARRHSLARVIPTVGDRTIAEVTRTPLFKPLRSGWCSLF